MAFDPKVPDVAVRWYRACQLRLHELEPGQYAVVTLDALKYAGGLFHEPHFASLRWREYAALLAEYIYEEEVWARSQGRVADISAEDVHKYAPSLPREFFRIVKNHTELIIKHHSGIHKNEEPGQAITDVLNGIAHKDVEELSRNAMIDDLYKTEMEIYYGLRGRDTV
ncbi:hypothetical protein KEM56_007199 [Ascosphaera pollenicola]|nr:hypothetical protein KEM56_007199 [Ascosphaera pollenicola]